MLRSRRRNRIAFAIALIAVVIVADLAAQFYRVYSAPPPLPFPGPAYLAAEYHQLNEHLTDAGYWMTNEYHGAYYNFNADGERRVVGQPSRYLHTVWLFGNSGTQDPYVSDAQSMASQLQAMLPIYRIVNRSAGGQLLSGEVAWLRETPIRPGDAVAFIDGAMDASAKTPPERYLALIAEGRTYAARHGASLLHFIQPYIDGHYSDALPGQRLYVPPADFFDSAHTNADGDTLVARALFDALTLI